LNEKRLFIPWGLRVPIWKMNLEKEFGKKNLEKELPIDR